MLTFQYLGNIDLWHHLCQNILSTNVFNVNYGAIVFNCLTIKSLAKLLSRTTWNSIVMKSQTFPYFSLKPVEHGPVLSTLKSNCCTPFNKLLIKSFLQVTANWMDFFCLWKLDLLLYHNGRIKMFSIVHLFSCNEKYVIVSMEYIWIWCKSETIR